MKKILFVYNPFSGKALIRNYLYDIMQEFRDFGCEIVVHPTSARLEAKEYILEHEGDYDMIICSGGDGTLNETVSALMDYKGEMPPLGYIPSGSTNDFARSLGIPRKMKDAARSIVNGKVKKVDIGLFNNRYFTYVAAMGAFTEVSYATPQNMKNILGHQAYVLEGIKQLTAIKPSHLTIITENGSYEGDYIYGMVTNTVSVGGYKGISGKNVNLSDGYFEVTFIRQPTTPAHMQNIVQALLMQDYSSDIVYFSHVNKITIKSEQPVAWVLDGEFGGEHKEVNINVLQEAVGIVLENEAEEI